MPAHTVPIGLPGWLAKTRPIRPQVASRLSDLSREELEDLLIKAEAERKAAVNKRKRLHFLFVVLNIFAVFLFGLMMWIVKPAF
ncbi:hypothetical protein CHLRE_08g367900v5 [Chlamydomonas reinhardtii]|uniref:Uncharacterized protein n=1 Tax=Chlamydomonas reinhardtii TaxID=3055 RepID=A0A2K3DH29_CHLRE|nr:uncharacterized protein CHLRE_08g367900v5 [Chlamydomonas reinhardtii]PNW79816.1 hypothetical protein CHLRE_08g367900v5 [Chlamydomonas reinhardtii]